MNSEYEHVVASSQSDRQDAGSRQVHPVSRRLVVLYLLNFALIFTHEIDSAYWHEWDLFGISGGIQVFLALNFFLLLVALYGFARLLSGKRDGYIFSLLLAAGGLFAFFIHSYFLLIGRPEFRLPLSIILLVVILPVSGLQLWITWQKYTPKQKYMPK